jgi:hypothetical protein
MVSYFFDRSERFATAGDRLNNANLSAQGGKLIPGKDIPSSESLLSSPLRGDFQSDSILLKM